MTVMTLTSPRPLDTQEESLVTFLLQIQAELEQPPVRALDKIDTLVSGEQTEVMSAAIRD